MTSEVLTEIAHAPANHPRTQLGGGLDGEDAAQREVRGFTLRQRFDLIGAGAAGAALAALLFGWFAPLSGAIGWVVVAFLAFLGLHVLLVSLDSDSRR